MDIFDCTSIISGDIYRKKKKDKKYYKDNECLPKLRKYLEMLKNNVIDNIAQNNPNIFQKNYSEIKYLWHQFKGYKTQNQFVNDLYYKWTQTYNSDNILNSSESYSIEQSSKGRYVKVIDK